MPDAVPPPPDRKRRVQLSLLGLVALILLAWALKASRDVTLPLALALFVAQLLHPVQERVQRRLPKRLKWLGLVAAMLVLFAGLAALGGGMAFAASQVKREAPELKATLGERVGRLRAWAEEKGLPVQQAGDGGGAMQKAVERAPGVLGGVASGLGGLVLLVFFVALMLLEAPHWEVKVRRALPARAAERVLAATHETGEKVRHYLWTLTVIGVISGVLEGGWLALMGVKLAVVWGLLFFVLNYIPAIGSILAAIPPLLFAFATLDPGKALGVAAGLLVIDQVMGNLVTPLVQGKGVSLSPLVTLVSVVVWEFIWGPVGALLSVPLTAAVVTACRHVPALQPVAIMLGEGKRERDEGGRTG